MEEGALVPFEVYVLIVSKLPMHVVYELWCTGRELHSQRELFNDCVLPWLRIMQWRQFRLWMHASRAPLGWGCKDKHAIMDVRAGPYLEAQGPFAIRFDSADSVCVHNVTGSLYRAKRVLPTFIAIKASQFADCTWRSDEDDGLELTVWYEDELRRYDVILVARIEYWNWPCRWIVVCGSVVRRGHLVKNRLLQLAAERGLA